MTASSSTATPVTAAVPRWRRIFVTLLVVFGCVLAPLSVFAVWTRNTLLNTNQYVDTVAPLAKNPAIVDRLTTVSVEALFAHVNVEQQIREALPGRAAVIAPAVAQAVQQLAHDVTHGFLESKQFQTLWREANRRAHTLVRAILTGEGNSVKAGGKVVVQLGPVVQDVRAELKGLGLDIFPNSSGQPVNTELVLFESKGLATVQGGVNLLQALAVVLPILTILLFAAAVLMSTGRRRTLLRASLGLVLAMALLLILFNVGRSVYLNAFNAAGRDAAGAAYDQVLGFLRVSVRAVFTLGLVVAIGAWMAGPGRVAKAVRGAGQRLAGGTGDQAAAVGVDLRGAGALVARYRTPLRVIMIGLGAGVLMVLSSPSVWTALVVAVLVLVGLALIEALARVASVGSVGTTSKR
jgi:hypothetical protein